MVLFHESFSIAIEVCFLLGFSFKAATDAAKDSKPTGELGSGKNLPEHAGKYGKSSKTDSTLHGLLKISGSPPMHSYQVFWRDTVKSKLMKG